MSEPSPEQGPPLDPDELRRLAEMTEQAGNMPDFTGAAILAMTAVHAQWYRGWQAAGIPENRAAEFTAVLIAHQVSGG